MDYFDDFTLSRIAVDDGEIRLRHAGGGPPLLLLHGNPQTHLMWHSLAPTLAQKFSVYCPDLRGYGESFKPAASADHAPYAKRNMARDVRVAVPWYKPANNRTRRVPDYYLHETDEWLVLPWELNGLTEDEIFEHKPYLKPIFEEARAEDSGDW